MGFTRPWGAPFVVAALVTAVAACVDYRVSLPAGPAAPAPEAVAAWDRASAACRSVTTFTAEIRVSGRVGAGRRPLSGTLQGILTRSDQIRLEFTQLGGGFTLAGGVEAATLVVPHVKRVVTAPASDIVEALTGLRLGPRELLAVFSGCVVPDGAATDGQRVGNVLSVSIGAGRAFLRREGDAWQIVFGQRPGLILEYRRASGDWPNDIHIQSVADAAVPLTLTVGLDQVDVNAAIKSGAFVVQVPVDFQRWTLDELRAAGPLGEERDR